MKLNPDKQHIIFYAKRAELESVEIPHGEMIVVIHYNGFDEILNRFNHGVIRIMAVNRLWITGWRTTKTSDEVDVHYTYPVGEDEKRQGDARLTSMVVANQRRAAEERAEENRIARIKGRSIYGE